MNKFKKWYSEGTPWLWISASSIALCLVIVIGIVGYISIQAIPHFWPAPIETIQITSKNGVTAEYYGELYAEETVRKKVEENNGNGKSKYKTVIVDSSNYKISNNDFIWIDNSIIDKRQIEKDSVVFERREKGNLYAKLLKIKENDVVLEDSRQTWEELQARIERVAELHEQISEIQKDKIGAINYQQEKIRLHIRYLELKNKITDADSKQAQADNQKLQDEYNILSQELNNLRKELQRDSVTVVTKGIGGETEQVVPVENIVRAYRPNNLSVLGKTGVYFDRLGEYLFDEPREANTEGGVFPAIFGTVMMVLLMTVFVTPFGILAAIYLREYAKQGYLTRLIRIAVVNLAGVPSIVYGVFGLGFFVYVLGEHIDELFFPEALPTPTFGTPGILWSAITLALLTLPVVIVTTEEGLSRIPRALREGSLALGATKSETLWKVILPISTPSMITGLILAIARAAGEVAPLMLVGVVKMAPTLPLDGNFPYLHMERKFMHLGFHIYDVGFQSPNVEAARPLVFATAFLLIVVIILLNIVAIILRNRLREKYKSITG
ncbi:MAG: phosphate ABC transporter permease PstA [Gammaproteobacteria bacterium]|nr:MAG: phosphate ABC transporter permease PstA [Gammaproteobacteria bacterium]